ncbi:MAG: FdhD protein [Thermacetogenium sp.]|nr:FdhD protein [Thermacetogenium sp.]
MSSSDGDYGKLTFPCQIVKADSGRHWLEEDLVVRETPLTVFVNSREIATLVCSPVDQVYLAVGFLCSEGVLKKREDLESVELDADRGLIRIKTAPLPGIEERMFLKRHITPSAGRSNIRVHFAADAGLPPPVTSQLQIKAATATRLAAELQERAHLFRRTGGVHNAALVQGEEILIFQEDIGRHNTID